MRIQEFNTEVSLGTVVRYNRMPSKVIDIDRTEHRVKLAPIGKGYKILNWVRYSELALIHDKGRAAV